MRKYIYTCIAASAWIAFSSCKKDVTDNSVQTAFSNSSIYGRPGTGTGGDSTAPPAPVVLGNLNKYLFVFTGGATDANWQGATKGYLGDVAANTVIAHERFSGSVPYAGILYSTSAIPGQWQNIINQNPTQSSVVNIDEVTMSGLSADLASSFAQINALPVTPAYSSATPQSLDGLNTQNGVAETFVINITSGMLVSTQIHISGDSDDVFVLRWDTDANPANGYQGIVKFQMGGAIVPGGNLKATNFLHVAGDISASGGGTNPPAPYPQGPRYNDGNGPLIINGTDFTGGGFFTGYWLTTGDPVTHTTQPLSNAVFVGGWYSSTSKFSMTGGTSAVHISPPSILTP